MEWSPDSKFVSCTLTKRSCVEVWSVDDAKFICKIENGPAGVSNARFCLDSRHILVFSDFQLRVSVWDILKSHGPLAHIRFPKYSSKGFDFTNNDMKLLAIAERKDCKDYVSVITTDSWELIKVRTKAITR